LNKTKSATFPDLLEAAGLLKRVKRSGWLKKAGITFDRESVADHSYRMAIIALLVGTEFQIDAWKLVRMCLVHDIAESVLGDRMPEEKKSLLSHRQEENRVVHEILKKLPSRSETILERDWSELLESKTLEAKLARKIDRLEMVLQARDYMRMGYQKKSLAQFTKVKLDKRLSAILSYL
jgi:putative hydrolase of HD superfamily